MTHLRKFLVEVQDHFFSVYLDMETGKFLVGVTIEQIADMNLIPEVIMDGIFEEVKAQLWESTVEFLDKQLSEGADISLNTVNDRLLRVARLGLTGHFLGQL